MQIYTTPLNTTIFLTSQIYGGRQACVNLENFNIVKSYFYINLTQNKIIIVALMHKIRTHPFYF